jgi:hypothetical protein
LLPGAGYQVDAAEAGQGTSLVVRGVQGGPARCAQPGVADQQPATASRRLDGHLDGHLVGTRLPLGDQLAVDVPADAVRRRGRRLDPVLPALVLEGPHLVRGHTMTLGTGPAGHILLGSRVR